MTTDATTDTSVLIKGIVPPRRKIRDRLYDEQLRHHLKSKKILRKVEAKVDANHVSLVALIETSPVISRLTDDTESVSQAISFVALLCR